MPETPTTYRVLYLRRAQSGATAVLPWRIYDQATLRRFLQHFAPRGAIEQILTGVAAGNAQVLDLGAMDAEHIAHVLRHYVPGPIPPGPA